MDKTHYKEEKSHEMSSNESAPWDLHDDVSNITITSKKWEIGDKIRAFWMQQKKTCKMVETFSALWRDAELEGVILGSWLEKKTNKMGHASWADRNRGCIIALFLAIRLWRSCKNSNEITRDPNEYLFSQIRLSVRPEPHLRTIFSKLSKRVNVI